MTIEELIAGHRRLHQELGQELRNTQMHLSALISLLEHAGIITEEGMAEARKATVEAAQEMGLAKVAEPVF
jgi:hypothetical protein